MGYLNATLGVAKVPEQEVRKIVGGNAVKLWGFDVEKLQPVVDAYAPTVSEILRIPPEGYIPCGDVNKPFGEVRLSYTAADLGEGKTSGRAEPPAYRQVAVHARASDNPGGKNRSKRSCGDELAPGI